MTYTTARAALSAALTKPLNYWSKTMQTRFLFNRINQDITAAIARQVDRESHTRTHAPTNDDLVCAIIFIASIIVLIYI